MRVLRALFVTAMVALFRGTVHGQTSTRFKATIHAGESYTRAIGHGLYFVVDQVDGGDWNFQIRIYENGESYRDCLNSPFLHGPSTTDLTAWRFAPDADTGWAEHIPAKKEFFFVTTAADQKYECAESKAAYDSFQRSQSRGADPDYSGLPHYKPRPRGHGKVNVTNLALKAGLSGQDAEFSQITIQVRIQLPFRKKSKSYLESGIDYF